MTIGSDQYGTLAIAATVAFLLGLLIAWLLTRGASFRRGRGSRDVEVTQLANERDASLEARRRLQQEHDLANRRLEESRQRIVEISEQRAASEGRLERLTQIESELATAREQVAHWNEACQRAEQRLTETATRLQEQTHAATERESMLKEAGEERERLLKQFREEFTDRFKSLSSELLDVQSQKFTEQNQSHMGNLLNPLREQLGDFRKRVDDVYDKESRERQLLKAEIDTLKNLNQRISDDAVNLTRALKGEARTQGAWGELVLERLLEASGLQKGREYEVQTVLRDDEGGRPRPDVIVRLPEGRDLIIDAKVSLTAYERYCAATDDLQRGDCLAAHLSSMRTHVRQLAERRYSDLPGVNSLEFVMMFVPVEAAFIEAARNDDALHAFALERQIVIVTTSTLLATLRTVASLWRFDDRNRNAFDIAERAGKLYDKFVGFVEDIEDAKKRLDAARNSLSAASDKLVTGRGNLVGQVEKLRELGAKASKSIPADVRGRSDLEPGPGDLIERVNLPGAEE
jgi:DNA recombination protein RmuC